MPRQRCKLDHRFNAGDEFSVRYSLYDVNSRNSRGAGGLNAESASAALDDTDHSIALSNIATLSSKFVNETRGQFTYSNLKAPPTDSIGPAVSISGVATRHARFSCGKTQQALRGCGQSFVSVRRAFDSSRSGLPLQLGHHHLPAIFSRQLFIFLARQFPHRNV